MFLESCLISIDSQEMNAENDLKCAFEAGFFTEFTPTISSF